MHSKIQLQINEPCHENWNKMTNYGQGRFCGSCQKMVIDFTGMNDETLLAFFKNYDGNICGRFEDEQLNRPLLIESQTKLYWHKWTFTVLFAGILLFNRATAQGKIILKEQVLAKKSIVGQGKKTRQISGNILDENGNRIPYASIMIKNENWGTASDKLGNFALKINSSARFVEILVSSVGYLNNQIKVDLSDTLINRQTIVLNKQNIEDDVIVIGYGAIKCRSLSGTVSVFQEKSSPTKSNKVQGDIIKGDTIINGSFKIYPNPAKGGSTIKLQFTQPENYLVKLINMNGQIISTQNILIQEKDETFNFIVPALLSSGQYFISAATANNKFKTTNKLVVIR